MTAGPGSCAWLCCSNLAHRNFPSIARLRIPRGCLFCGGTLMHHNAHEVQQLGKNVSVRPQGSLAVYQVGKQRLLCSWHQPSNATQRTDLPQPDLLAREHSGGCCPNGVGHISCSPINEWEGYGEVANPFPLHHSPAGLLQAAECRFHPLLLSGELSFVMYHGWQIAAEPLIGWRGKVSSGKWGRTPNPREGCARLVMPESCSLAQPGLQILRSWLLSFGDT